MVIVMMKKNKERRCKYVHARKYAFVLHAYMCCTCTHTHTHKTFILKFDQMCMMLIMLHNSPSSAIQRARIATIGPCCREATLFTSHRIRARINIYMLVYYNCNGSRRDEGSDRY
jgi:hypothetical protein